MAVAVRWMENDKKVGHNKTIKSHKKNGSSGKFIEILWWWWWWLW